MDAICGLLRLTQTLLSSKFHHQLPRTAFTSKCTTKNPKAQSTPPPSGAGMVVQGDERKKMKVMVAIDESDESFYALKWALDNLFPSLLPTPEASQDLGVITLVHVQQPLQHFIFPAGPGPAVYTGVVESVRKAQQENSAVILSRALLMCKDKTITVESLVLDGDPKDMICHAAEETHVDLLVVGSRGLGKIKRAFLGSVSDFCAHHAKCPILIVKPPKETK